MQRETQKKKERKAEKHTMKERKAEKHTVREGRDGQKKKDRKNDSFTPTVTSILLVILRTLLTP